MDKKTAHSIVAFGIVNLNVPLPLETLYNLTPTDPLYQELLKAFSEREERLDRRTALLCCVIANCMGGGKKQFKPDDFMPVRPKTIQDSEAEIKRNFISYNERVKARMSK